MQQQLFTNYIPIMITLNRIENARILCTLSQNNSMNTNLNFCTNQHSLTSHLHDRNMMIKDHIRNITK